MTLLHLLACSDYKVIAQDTEPSAPEPDTATVTEPVASPDIDAASSEGTCAADGTSLTVTVSNTGEADLEVASLSASGDGWTLLRYDALPWTLAPGEAATVDLGGGVGEGALVVVSSDPDEPSLEVPLGVAPGAAAPTVVFTSPADDSVLGTDTTVITALLSDDATAPEALVVTWTSDVDEEACDGSVGADGVVSCTWDPASRAVGAHHLTLTATDACGASATATLALCQDGLGGSNPLDNASFEDPVISGMSWFEAGDIDGWVPTSGNVIEVWEDGFNGVPAWDGNQFVEINGSNAGGIYQDIPTVPGASYTFTLAHRGRAGADVARLVVDGVEIDRYSDGVGAWGEYTSTFTATATTTHVQFESVSSTGGAGVGNFLDIVDVTGPCDGFDG